MEKATATTVVVFGAQKPGPVISVRDAMEQTFVDMGGVPALTKWAKKNPAQFYRMWSKMQETQSPTSPKGNLLDVIPTRLSESTLEAKVLDFVQRQQRLLEQSDNGGAG